jgi:hypothetical protein
LEQETSGSKTKLTIKTPRGEVSLPSLIRGKYIPFSLFLHVERDWRLIQLIFSLPKKSRTKFVRDMLNIVINAAYYASERYPVLMSKPMKKLTEEQKSKLLRTALDLV